LDSAELDKQNYEREMSAFKKTETFKASAKRKKKNQVNHVPVSQQSSPLDMNISGANSSFGAHGHTVVTIGNLPGSSGMTMMNRATHMNHDNTGTEIPIFTEEFLHHSTGWLAYNPFSLHRFLIYT